MKHEVYRFGRFRLDVAARELGADGKRLQPAPKVFDALVWLVRNRDRAVGRDELIAAVWGRTDVTDAQLGQVIRKLRRLIGDDAKQTWVLTLPRYGYRWVAETTLVERVPPHAEPPLDPTPPEARRRAQSIIAPLLLLAAIVAALVAGFWWWRREPADASPVVAVLPARVEPDDPDTAWLRVGLMEFAAGRMLEAGMRVVPGERVLAIARDGSADGPSLSMRVAAATDARRILSIEVRRVAEGWSAHIAWEGDAMPARETRAVAGDPGIALALAQDRLLSAIGLQPPETGEGDARSEWRRIDGELASGHPARARERLESLAPALRDSVDGRLREAAIDLATQRMQEAAALYQDLLEQTPPLDGEHHVAALLGAAGPVAQQGDIDRARAMLDEAIGLLGTMNQPSRLGEAYLGRAMFRMVQGDLSGAEDDCARSRIALELAADRFALAQLDGQEAVLLALRDRHEAALERWQAAADRFERFGDAEKFVDALGNVADEQLALLRPEAALATIRRADPWLARMDQPLSRALFDYAGAKVLARSGRFAQARERLDALLAQPVIDDIAGMPEAVRIERARLDLAVGRAGAAEAELRRAMADVLRPELASPLYRRIRSNGWLAWIRALRADGRLDQAKEQAQRFAAAAATGSADPALAQVARAETSVAKGDREDARAACESALTELGAQRGSERSLEVVRACAGMWLDAGEPGPAIPLVGRLGNCGEHAFDCAVLQARLFHALGRQDAMRHALANAARLAGERVIALDRFGPTAAGEKENP